MRKTKKMMMSMWILLSLVIGCDRSSQGTLGLTAPGRILTKEKMQEEHEKNVGVTDPFLKKLKHIGALEKKDLDDLWIFGLTVTRTNNFFGGVVSAHSDAKIVQLIPYKGRLYLYDVLDEKVVMNLDMEKKGGFDLIHFASALNNKNIKDMLKLETQRRTQVASYMSQGQSKVLSTHVEKDRVIIDLRYPMAGSMEKDGEVIKREGSVDLRLFLVRRSTLPLEKAPQSVAQSMRDKYAFFGPKNGGDDEKMPIRRFSLKSGKISFYLKDFPQDMIESAREAILSWNDAFDGKPIEVKIATKDIEIGDPRYNVVKWVKNTDKYTGWAGIAVPVFADPLTGTIVSGSLLINGDLLREDYAKRFSYAKTSSNMLKAKFGSLELFSGRGEVPVIPQFTGTTSFYEYMKGYYTETISHEIGHVLGLRHNFKGTVHAERGHTNSVMDYLPRKERAEVYGIGGYDKGAIDYAYYNGRENNQYAFCTDDHVQKQYDCNQGDVGEPIDHTFKALQDGLEAVATIPLRPHDKGTLSPIGSVLMNALKISLLKDQIESRERKHFVESQKFKKTINKLCELTPSFDLSFSERGVVSQNIMSIKEGVVKKIKGLKPYPGFVYRSLYSDYISHLQKNNLLNCFF